MLLKRPSMNSAKGLVVSHLCLPGASPGPLQGKGQQLEFWPLHLPREQLLPRTADGERGKPLAAPAAHICLRNSPQELWAF